MRAVTRSRLLGCLLASTICCRPYPIEGQAPTPEYRLKAAFLYRFAEFVTWPEAALTGPEVALCVTKPSPFGSVLAAMVTDAELNGRKFVVREVDSPQNIDRCHVLFISNASGGPLLEAARSLPVLTVGEYDAFLDRGGIIKLRLANGHIGFDVNEAAARRADLRLSSQLLKLAISVREEAR